jgi:hypothetical protein
MPKIGTFISRVPAGGNLFTITSTVNLVYYLDGVEQLRETHNVSFKYALGGTSTCRSYTHVKLSNEDVEALNPTYGKVEHYRLKTYGKYRGSVYHELIHTIDVSLLDNMIRVSKIDDILSSL